MNKMISRNPESRPPHLNLKFLQQQMGGAQKRVYGRHDEPKSVLDIRSPSPTSTLSCSLDGVNAMGSLPTWDSHQGIGDCSLPLDQTKNNDAYSWQFMGDFATLPTKLNNNNMGMEYLENVLLECPPSNDSSSNSVIDMQTIKVEEPLQFPEVLPNFMNTPQIHSNSSIPLYQSSSGIFGMNHVPISANSDYHYNFKIPPLEKNSPLSYPSFGAPLEWGQGHGQGQGQGQGQHEMMMGHGQGQGQAQGQSSFQDALWQQVLEAAKYAEMGCLDYAQAILARLNQFLLPRGKALQRVAYYFKEAILALKSDASQQIQMPTPVDVVEKMMACKKYTETSPVSCFANVSANQIFLEALEACDRIHIIDFDIGVGGQWASFMRELALRAKGTPISSFTITAIIPHESLETHLIRQSLCDFAQALNLPFMLNFVPMTQNLMLDLREHEAVAVNYSLRTHAMLSKETATSLLHTIKQICPKVVVVVDEENEQHGFCSFSERLREVIKFYGVLFESLEVVSRSIESVEVIEKSVMAPRINSLVMEAFRRHKEGKGNLPYWKNMFLASGFTPSVLSGFVLKQAECLLKSPQQQRLGLCYESLGFCLEAVKKQQEHGLVLGWQRRALASVFAWSPISVM